MYQPEMSEENIRKLYLLKLEKKRPMTKLLNQILDEYFQQGGKKECMNVNPGETHSKANRSTRKGRTTTTSDTGTVPSTRYHATNADDQPLTQPTN